MISVGPHDLLLMSNAAMPPGAGAAASAPRAKQWELVEFIGSGSLADIYRARPIGMAAGVPGSYAVKLLRPCWQNDPRALRLLQREALVGRSISHPHVVPILACSLREPPHLLVMPWLTGASLRAHLASGRRFAVVEALWIARQVAEALKGLYGNGWMHGDVSPANIHVSPSGHATLLDLSFARRLDEDGAAADRPIMGTVAYLAPEYLATGFHSDIRSDIYSLGAVLYELFSGRCTFAAETLDDLAIAHRQLPPWELSQAAPHIPCEVARLVQRMMAHDPLRRPQSPQEVIEQIVALEIATFAARGAAPATQGVCRAVAQHERQGVP